MRLITASLVLGLSVAQAAPVMSGFVPARHSFKFANTFNNDFIPSIDVRTAGLCGGMVYSALDYYNRRAAIPAQDYRPANRTPLQSYIYNRQVRSIEGNVDKWAEVIFNPGGARNTEFFNWGLQAGPGGRITELRAALDAGRPTPIGLKDAYGTSGDHQVLAIGYDLGRYRGDLGNFKEDFKIFVYDPNYPGVVRTLIPRLADQTYTYAENSNKAWRTYFVDRNYAAQVPPAIVNPVYPNDGTVRELLLTFHTGNDDLRGGNDNLNLVVKLKSGAQQVHNNINLGARWLNNYSETVKVQLSAPIPLAQLHSLVITATFGGGIGGDNWDMAKMYVRVIGGSLDRTLKQVGYKRFTGDDKSLTVLLPATPDVPPGLVNRVYAYIKTGGDDLRGGNDNLNIQVFFRDATSQTFTNVNGSGRWADQSENEETLVLNRNVRPEDITRIVLSTTFGGGFGGDNWNMDALELRALGNGVDVRIGSHGYKRFTGDDKTLSIATRPMP